MPDDITRPIFTDRRTAMDALAEKPLPVNTETTGWDTTAQRAEAEAHAEQHARQQGSGQEHDVGATIAFLWLMGGIAAVLWTCFHFNDRFGRVCMALARCDEPVVTDARFDWEGRPVECEFSN